MLVKLRGVCCKPISGYQKYCDITLQYKCRWFLLWLGLNIKEKIILRNVEELKWWLNRSHITSYYINYALTLGHKEVANYLKTRLYPGTIVDLSPDNNYNHALVGDS